jgi:hypothetical protein
MKAYWGSGGIASRPGRFTRRDRTHGTHWIGGWVGPRADLDAVSKRKIPSPRRDSNPDHQARSQSLYRLSYPGSLVTYVCRLLLLLLLLMLLLLLLNISGTDRRRNRKPLTTKLHDIYGRPIRFCFTVSKRKFSRIL